MRWVILTLLFSSLIYGESGDLTTSIIIPCIAQHAHYLYDLLRHYEKQTELPDEIVISLSSSDEVVHRDILGAVKEHKWSFSVTLLETEQKLFAGENRNRACEHAAGPLLICQDADDFPHPQRVQIIKYFFTTYKIDHLIHQLVWLEQEHTLVRYNDLEEIPFFYPTTLEEIRVVGTFTNGNIALTKEVFTAVKWSAEPRGEDVAFNNAVYARFNGYLAVTVPLLMCR